jgi:two-component system sensor histidine kinase DegS
MKKQAAPPPSDPGEDLLARLQADVAQLDMELEEIDMLVGQARAEAARHEQKRAQAAEKVAGAKDPAEAYGQLVLLTKRAVLMETQVDVLDGKRRSLGRHRDAIAAVAEDLGALGPGVSAAIGPGEGGRGEQETLPPSLSRVVLNAQEDLRREIARSMHDGPAQSLTNITLQAQIVDRLLDRDPDGARGELRLLVQMVQQTLDATKNFIFDVRPMVLDDLGLVPTLRRAARERGRRAHVPVAFDSLGTDRRLPQDVESTVFRILDEALGAYLALGPDNVALRLDWTDDVEASLVASRAAAIIEGHDEPLPEVPTGDVPDAIKQMIQDRHDARVAAVDAAEQAAIVVLPPAARRDILERAGSIGASVEVLAGGGELRLVVPLPAEPEPEP